ncbi:hypothetical protein MXC99_01090 [Thauera aromatica]|uniref:hypothetical protein n=1 Tax=Thauera aromatica TaxID=59405 RepID=UPI001FFDDF0D|nr:hypothetical protein [Thauera aromatica]MCK2086788.1 hypothetical protein [Thauera aromatica]
MKLIAKVTLVTGAGDIPPGGEIDVKDKAEAESLIARGFATPVRTASPKAEPKGEDQGEAGLEGEGA